MYTLTKDRPKEGGFYYLVYGDGLKELTVAHIISDNNGKFYVQSLVPVVYNYTTGYQPISYDLDASIFDKVYFSKINNIDPEHLKHVQEYQELLDKHVRLNKLKDEVNKLEEEINSKLQRQAASPLAVNHKGEILLKEDNKSETEIKTDIETEIKTTT